jgi:hypothetical protein
MKVLLLEGEHGAADEVVRQLTVSGHEVTSCHDRDGESFPCEGMIDGHSCPLDGEGVDVALVVRGELSPSLTAREDGVRCALRRHVPLVLAGVTDGSPYVGWATAMQEGVDEVVGVVEDAAAAPLERHGAAAQRAIVDLLVQEGIDTSAVTVEVHRRRAQLRATVHHAVPLEQRVADALAVRVQAALRGLDAYATKIDVVVDEYEPAI